MNFKLARRALSFFLWVIVALSPTRSFAQELLRVPYGVTTSLQHLPILVGKDSGLFAKYGLNVEPVHIRGGALITTMIMSGTGSGISCRIFLGMVPRFSSPVATQQ